MTALKELRDNNRILNYLPLIKQKNESLLKYDSIGVVELHLTDRCDLKCIYCSYGCNFKDSNHNIVDFPFDQIDKIIG